MKYFLLGLILLCSCSSKVKVEGVPSQIKGELGPDFTKASKFCDDRYGADTDEAESCFQDYRNYFELKISLDLQSLEDFCQKLYTTEDDVQGCVKDLVDILINATA